MTHIPSDLRRKCQVFTFGRDLRFWWLIQGLPTG
jgi:hypothetical protein